MDRCHSRRHSFSEHDRDQRFLAEEFVFRVKELFNFRCSWPEPDVDMTAPSDLRPAIVAEIFQGRGEGAEAGGKEIAAKIAR